MADAMLLAVVSAVVVGFVSLIAYIVFKKPSSEPVTNSLTDEKENNTNEKKAKPRNGSQSGEETFARSNRTCYSRREKRLLSIL